MPNKCKNCVHEKVCRIKEFPSIDEILKTGCPHYIPLENLVSKSKYQSVVNENAKLNDCVQDLLKDQDVLNQLLEKEKEKTEKIFEEIDDIRLKYYEGLYTGEQATEKYLEVEKKYIGANE